MITAKVSDSRFSRLKMPSRSNQYYSAEIGPTELYHIPNQQKFNKYFNGCFRFEIAAFFEGENLFLLTPLFMPLPFFHIYSLKSGLVERDFISAA